MLNRRIIFYLSLSAIIFLLIIPGIRNSLYYFIGDFFYPFIKGTRLLIDKGPEIIKVLESKYKLTKEVEILKKENLILKSRLTRINIIERDNQQLHKLLKLKSNPYYKYIFAEIITRDPIRWFEEFTIDKGRKDGIKPGALVIAETKPPFSKIGPKFAVVGRVSILSKHTAIVYTMLNEDCHLSVMIPANGSTGILYGGERYNNLLLTKAKYLPRDLEYESGSRVQTSGLNNMTPEAIPIGRIAGVPDSINKSSKLYTEIKIIPYVDFNHLKYIVVLVKKG